LKLKETYFTALSALLRGQFLAIQRLFIQKGGIELLIILLKSQNTSLRLKRKVEFLLQDLIHMDSFLHFGTIERDVKEKISLKNPEKPN